jgi:hypothetical protein
MPSTLEIPYLVSSTCVHDDFGIEHWWVKSYQKTCMQVVDKVILFRMRDDR